MFSRFTKVDSPRPDRQDYLDEMIRRVPPRVPTDAAMVREHKLNPGEQIAKDAVVKAWVMSVPASEYMRFRRENPDWRF